jgi:hypothetical protein
MTGNIERRKEINLEYSTLSSGERIVTRKMILVCANCYTGGSIGCNYEPRLYHNRDHWMYVTVYKKGNIWIRERYSTFDCDLEHESDLKSDKSKKKKTRFTSTPFYY